MLTICGLPTGRHCVPLHLHGTCAREHHGDDQQAHTSHAEVAIARYLHVVPVNNNYLIPFPPFLRLTRAVSREHRDIVDIQAGVAAGGGRANEVDMDTDAAEDSDPEDILLDQIGHKLDETVCAIFCGAVLDRNNAPIPLNP